MPRRERERDDGAPGVADDDRPLDPQSLQRLVEQLGLLHRRPHAPARALAMPEAGAVEDDDSVVPEQPLGHAAGIVIIARHGVAVYQDDGLAGTPVAVVQPNPVHLDKPALGWVP